MYYYGHGSWIALVIFAGVFAVRALSSQRRRSSRQGGPPSRSSFTASHPGPPAGPPGTRNPAPSATGGGSVAPAWFRDPTGRHAQRYWSGADWTEHVMDDGVPAVDPPPASPPRREAD